MAERRFPVHRDGRGELVAVEGADVGFEVQRVFTVRGTADRAPRGGHVTGCRELLVLVAGSVSGVVRRGEDLHHFDLVSPGDAVDLGPTDHVDYTLDAASVLLVLSDRPFEERT